MVNSKVQLQVSDLAQLLEDGTKVRNFLSSHLSTVNIFNFWQGKEILSWNRRSIKIQLRIQKGFGPPLRFQQGQIARKKFSLSKSEHLTAKPRMNSTWISSRTKRVQNRNKQNAFCSVTNMTKTPWLIFIARAYLKQRQKCCTYYYSTLRS